MNTGVARWRKHMTKQRGLICEEHVFRGARRGARCLSRATGYQPRNDIFVCGVHARGYLHVETIPAPLALGEEGR